MGRDPFHFCLAIGCLAVVVGSTLVRFGRRHLHHTMTDPVGCGLILVGIAVLLLVKFLADPRWSAFALYNLAVGLFLGGSMLVRTKSKRSE